MSPSKLHELLLPLGIIACLLVFFVPLPVGMMDLLLSANIAIGLIVLLTTIYIRTPLEFSVFPTVLLATTLSRLVLNVATTRLILTNADTQKLSAAGDVIRQFGQFVAGDRVAVGFVIFIIIFVIQIMVITKGATRISEVAARFALDGIPGRQLAIDADRNAMVIDHHEAQRRRETLNRQADFYGAMDGASKFVRGDAMAGAIITVINIVGGLCVGVLQGGMRIGEAVEVYTKLTIGDGLTSQVPALLISLSAGMIVSRGSTSENLPSTFIRQLFMKPQVLGVAGLFLILLMFTKLPTLPLFLLGGGALGLAFLGPREPDATTPTETSAARSTNKLSRSGNTELRSKPTTRPGGSTNRIEDLLQVDPVEVELGLALLPLANTKRNGDLLERFTVLRQQVAKELGLVMPSVRVRDNLALPERGYVIKVSGNIVAKGELPSDGVVVLTPGGMKSRTLPSGIPWPHPGLGPNAKLIPVDHVGEAKGMGCRLVPSSMIVTEHLRVVVQELSHEMLTRDATRHLVDEVRKTCPTVVEELIPSQLTLSQVQHVLQGLLREGVPIRPLATILESLGDYVGESQNVDQLIEWVRRRLARTITSRFGDQEGKVHVVTLDPQWERQLIAANPQTATQLTGNERATFQTALRQAAQQLVAENRAAILLTSGKLRTTVRQLAQAAVPGIIVLGNEEICSDATIRSVGIVGIT